jgi:chromosome segregation ATPase
LEHQQQQNDYNIQMGSAPGQSHSSNEEKERLHSEISRLREIAEYTDRQNSELQQDLRQTRDSLKKVQTENSKMEDYI